MSLLSSALRRLGIKRDVKDITVKLPLREAKRYAGDDDIKDQYRSFNTGISEVLLQRKFLESIAHRAGRETGLHENLLIAKSIIDTAAATGASISEVARLVYGNMNQSVFLRTDQHSKKTDDSFLRYMYRYGD